MYRVLTSFRIWGENGWAAYTVLGLRAGPAIVPYLIPKLSESVKASLSRPDHCLEILPTSWLSSGVITYRIPKGQHYKGHRGYEGLPKPNKVITSVADSAFGAFLTPWSGGGMGKKSRSGSEMNILDHFSESLETIFWVKLLKFSYSWYQKHKL
jgi:hypothetical protein